MKALIMCNGERVCDKILKNQNADFVICADGAAIWADEKNIKIDLMVGDFDSIVGGVCAAKKIAQKHGCEIVELEKKKDATDTKICIEKAKQKGATEIVFVGALGKRLDHSLGNIELLVFCAQIGIQAKIVDDSTQVQVSCTQIQFYAPKNSTVSLFPLGINVCIAATTNLAYPLNNAELPLGAAVGVSNVMDADFASVKVKSGWVVGVLNTTEESLAYNK